LHLQAALDTLWNIRPRRGQVTPSYRIVFFRRAESWPPYRAAFANAVLEKSTKNEKRPDSYKSGR